MAGAPAVGWLSARECGDQNKCKPAASHGVRKFVVPFLLFQAPSWKQNLEVDYKGTIFARTIAVLHLAYGLARQLVLSVTLASCKLSF